VIPGGTGLFTTKTRRTQRGKAATEKMNHKGTKTPRPFFWIVAGCSLREHHSEKMQKAKLDSS